MLRLHSPIIAEVALDDGGHFSFFVNEELWSKEILPNRQGTKKRIEQDG